MVIDARMTFARRVAKWMQDSELSQEELTVRLAKWPDDFCNLVIQATRELRAA